MILCSSEPMSRCAHCNAAGMPPPSILLPVEEIDDSLVALIAAGQVGRGVPDDEPLLAQLRRAVVADAGARQALQLIAPEIVLEYAPIRCAVVLEVLGGLEHRPATVGADPRVGVPTRRRQELIARAGQRMSHLRQAAFDEREHLSIPVGIFTRQVPVGREHGPLAADVGATGDVVDWRARVGELGNQG